MRFGLNALSGAGLALQGATGAFGLWLSAARAFLVRIAPRIQIQIADLALALRLGVYGSDVGKPALGRALGIGADARNRTPDPLLTRQLLFQLSYEGKLVDRLGIEPNRSGLQGLSALQRAAHENLARHAGIEPATYS